MAKGGRYPFIRTLSVQPGNADPRHGFLFGSRSVDLRAARSASQQTRSRLTMLLAMKTPIPRNKLILANQHPIGITKKAAVSHMCRPSYIR